MGYLSVYKIETSGVLEFLKKEKEYEFDNPKYGRKIDHFYIYLLNYVLGIRTARYMSNNRVVYDFKTIFSCYSITRFLIRK